MSQTTENIRRALSGRLGLLLLLLIASIQLAGIYPIPEEPILIPGQIPAMGFPFSSRICLFMAWTIILAAWWRHPESSGWVTLWVASGGFFLLVIFVFCPDSVVAGVWMARFIEKVPYPLRVAAVSLYPLCLHPISAKKILSLTENFSGFLRRWRYPVVFVIAFAGISWFLRSAHISRDGYQCIEFLSMNTWHERLREPLTILLHRLFAWPLMSWTRLTAEQSLSILSCTLGIPALLFLGQTIRLWSLEQFSSSRPECSKTVTGHRPAEGRCEQCTPWILVMASGGFTLTWFGHIEVYPVLIAGICCLIWLAARYLVHGDSPIWFALAYGFLLPVHLSAIWLLPAMIFLMALVWMRDGTTKVVQATAIILLLQTVIWGGICVVYYGGSFRALSAQFWGEMDVGLDRAMFYSLPDLFSIRRLLDVIQEFAYLSIPLILGLGALAFRRTKVAWSSLEIFLGLGAMGYAIYAVVWRADRGFPEDYDLFSPLALLAPLVVGMRLSHWRSQSRAAGTVIYLIVISAAPLLAYQLFAHIQLDTHIEYLWYLRRLRELRLIK